MSRHERRMSDEASLAIEQGNLDRSIGASHHRNGSRLRGVRDCITERHSRRRGVGKSLLRRIRRGDLVAQGWGTAGGYSKRSERGEIDRAALRMQVEQTLGELGHFAHAT